MFRRSGRGLGSGRWAPRPAVRTGTLAELTNVGEVGHPTNGPGSRAAALGRFRSSPPGLEDTETASDQREISIRLPFAVMDVAYQGEPGAFSEGAVLQVFPDAKPMPCETVRLVFSRVTSGEAAFGVVPLENSQAGSVNQTYDLLLNTSLLGIVGEAFVRVDHALLGVGGARLEQVRRARSHWQALAQ